MTEVRYYAGFVATLHSTQRWIAYVGFAHLPGAFIKDQLVATENPSIGLRVLDVHANYLLQTGTDWTVYVNVEVRDGAELTTDEVCAAMTALGFAREGSRLAHTLKQRASERLRRPFGDQPSAL